MIIKIILIKLDVIIIKRIWLKPYIKECDGVPIVANAPGAAARLDTPRHVFYMTILFTIIIFKNLRMFPKLCFSFISI
jgi:hypothetical protein